MPAKINVLLLLLTGLLIASPQVNAQSLRVTRVVDGDTFELSDGRTVRLIGVDTPETYSSDKLRRDARRSGRDIETIKALGRLSSRYARELAAGQPVELAYDPANAAQDHKGTYGRTLAYLWVLDSSGSRRYCVNKRLIQDGYARAYTQFPFTQREEYLRAQRAARKNERGLWGTVDLAAERQAPLHQTPRDDQPRKGDQDCSDFSSHAEAQRFFEVHGGPEEDPHRLDGDNDGLACEAR